MGTVATGPMTSQSVSSVVVPIPQKDSEVKQILKGQTSIIEDKAKKNFKTVRMGNLEFYGQIDPTSNEATGYGCLKRDGVTFFEGQFVNSFRNGYGIEYDRDKIVYEGTYVNDLRDGWGRTQFYQGEFCRGKKQGWGIQSDEAGRYQGYWKQDKQEGMGVKSYSYKMVESLFEFVTKQGIFSDTNSSTPCDIYIGEWKDGKRSGVGKFKSTRQFYTGEFFEDKYHGQGTLIVNNVTKKGVFESGIFIR